MKFSVDVISIGSSSSNFIPGDPMLKMELFVPPEHIRFDMDYTLNKSQLQYYIQI